MRAGPALPGQMFYADPQVGIDGRWHAAQELQKGSDCFVQKQISIARLTAGEFVGENSPGIPECAKRFGGVGCSTTARACGW